MLVLLLYFVDWLSAGKHVLTCIWTDLRLTAAPESDYSPTGLPCKHACDQRSVASTAQSIIMIMHTRKPIKLDINLFHLMILTGMWVSRPGLGLETDQDHFFEVLVLVSTRDQDQDLKSRPCWSWSRPVWSWSRRVVLSKT